MTISLTGPFHRGPMPKEQEKLLCLAQEVIHSCFQPKMGDFTKDLMGIPDLPMMYIWMVSSSSESWECDGDMFLEYVFYGTIHGVKKMLVGYSWKICEICPQDPRRTPSAQAMWQNTRKRISLNISTNRWKGKIPISNIYYYNKTYDNYIQLYIYIYTYVFQTKLIWAPQPMNLCGDMSRMKVKPIKMGKLSPVWSEGFLPRSFCKSGAMKNSDWCSVAQETRLEDDFPIFQIPMWRFTAKKFQEPGLSQETHGNSILAR